ncbi:MAG: hypothetical protein KDD60_08155, partial [Bdellovibrionales bacterium]|nr:hypothetical protein [Bdellovibrionales bacterium]
MSSSRRRNYSEIAVVVLTLALAIVFLFAFPAQKRDSVGRIGATAPVPESLHQLQTEYLQGHYSARSYFAEDTGQYSLLYNHRPSPKLWRISFQGRLLNTWNAFDPQDGGVHIVEQYGESYYSIVQVRRIEKFDSEFHSRWIRRIEAHHDVEVDPAGQVMVFDLEMIEVPYQEQLLQVYCDSLVTLSPDGAELGRIPLWPYLSVLLKQKDFEEAKVSLE